MATYDEYMSNILSINSGSTSFKYKLFDEKEKEIKQGNFENVADLKTTIKKALKEIADFRNVIAVGHRVVHGGEKYNKPILINNEILKELEGFNELAPLHNPYNLLGIKEIKEYLPDILQIAVFDTAFYFNLPEVARIYALPIQITEKYKIKRFGFHGISHQFAMQETAKQLKKEFNKLNLITCHLGGGWSITAIKKGQAIDTSMGYTPLEGLVMMTRAGDLDPGIIIELLKKSSKFLGEEKCEEVCQLLNNESGIKGLSGGINDYQELLKEISFSNQDARKAMDIAIYRLVKYIGAYWTILEGQVDAIVFTGAIGAGNPITRNQVMKSLKFLGNIPVLAIKSNEELMIAREVKEIINQLVV